MLPELSNRCINWILMGANVINPVFQILDYEKIPNAEENRYCFILSDGITWCCNVLLGTQLNHMVANKQLEKFTIVQVNKYVCSQVETDAKVIILLNLTVLVPGKKVKKKLGNPDDSSTGSIPRAAASDDLLVQLLENASSVSGHAETDYSNDYNEEAHIQSLIFHLQLTTGAISRILNEEDVTNPVIQILGLKRDPVDVDDFYKLVLFDGVSGWPFAMLGLQLNHMVVNKELEKFTVVRVDKYAYSRVTGPQKMIILLKVTVLFPGNEVFEKFGNPDNLPDKGRATTNGLDARRVADKGYVKQNETVFPQLTTGAIKRILDGEDVTNAVIQILGYEKIPAGKIINYDNIHYKSEYYRFLISDGDTLYCYVMLKSELNHIVANRELEEFTIVQVNEYQCNQRQTDPKIITLFNLTVLVPGNKVNKKIGNPVNSYTGGGATNIGPVKSGVAKTSNTNKKAKCAHVSSMITFPQLTAGAINQILNEEHVTSAIIQILGCIKLPGDRYHLLISDGITGCPLALLGTQLNHMVYNKELKQFTIVRVDKYVCNQLQDRKVIILLNLTVLVPGNEVNKKLGNPVSSYSGGSITNAPAENDVQTSPAKQSPVSARFSSVINRYVPPIPFTQFLHTMFPEVASGAINRILNGEEVANAVIQILGCRRIPGELSDRYRLLISDGVTGCSFVMLGTQLNHMVANKELEKFTIVRVEKCICNEVQVDRKVIILLNLTVLVPGNEVNKVLGDPVSSSTDTAATANDSSYSDGSALSVPFTQLHISLPQLTAGAINRILSEEAVESAIIQILGCKKIAGNDRYRLLISDGVTGYPFAMLGTQLNHMVDNKELGQFTIVQVEKFECNQVQNDRKVIILLNLSVLVPGIEVNEKLGNPVNSSYNGGATTNAQAVNDADETLKPECSGSS